MLTRQGTRSSRTVKRVLDYNKFNTEGFADLTIPVDDSVDYEEENSGSAQTASQRAQARFDLMLKQQDPGQQQRSMDRLHLFPGEAGRFGSYGAFTAPVGFSQSGTPAGPVAAPKSKKGSLAKAKNKLWGSIRSSKGKAKSKLDMSKNVHFSGIEGQKIPAVSAQRPQRGGASATLSACFPSQPHPLNAEVEDAQAQLTENEKPKMEPSQPDPLDAEIEAARAQLAEIGKRRREKALKKATKAKQLELVRIQELLDRNDTSDEEEPAVEGPRMEFKDYFPMSHANVAAAPPAAPYDTRVVSRVTRGSQKSGILLKPSDRVLETQVWAHTALRGDYLHNCPSWQNLQFFELVAGELEIITRLPVGSKEMRVRIDLLKRLAYLMRSHNWESVKAVYSHILGHIENGTLSWESHHVEISLAIQDCLLSSQIWRTGQSSRRPHKTQFNPSSDESKDYSKDAWCLNFNKGDCKMEAPHTADIRGQKVTCDHFCSKCWSVDAEKRKHAAKSQMCPNRT